MSSYSKTFYQHCLSHTSWVPCHPSEQLTALGMKLKSKVFSSMSTSRIVSLAQLIRLRVCRFFPHHHLSLFCGPHALLPELSPASPSELLAPDAVRSPQQALDVSETLNPSLPHSFFPPSASSFHHLPCACRFHLRYHLFQDHNVLQELTLNFIRSSKACSASRSCTRWLPAAPCIFVMGLFQSLEEASHLCHFYASHRSRHRKLIASSSRPGPNKKCSNTLIPICLDESAFPCTPRPWRVYVASDIPALPPFFQLRQWG